MKVKQGIGELKSGLKYMFLNHFVNHIPAWSIRKVLYKALGMHIGIGSRIALGTVVLNPSGISIGERVIVNESCHLDGRGGLTIENDTSISFGSTVITASHRIEGFEYFLNPVTIADHVWIGAHAIILDGSVLESYSVIGAGAVVKGSVEENAIMTGNPAKILRYRNRKENYSLNYTPFFR